MKIAYLLEDKSLCGGVKVVLQHAVLLAKEGFSVTIISRTSSPEWFDTGDVVLLTIDNREFSEVVDLLAAFDLVIATHYPQVLKLYGTPVRLAHFSQGYEADYPFWQGKRSDIEKAYRLPVPKVTISRRVAAIIENVFFQVPHYVQQGIDIDKFFVKKISPVVRRIIIVGTWENGIKGIAFAVKGFSLAREKMKDLSLVRVSTLPLSEEEREVWQPEEYHSAVSPADMPALYGGCDIAIVPSAEGEGFGLPAIEAMACGLPVILTRIHSFLSLDDDKDYAYFVSPSSAGEIAEAIIRLCGDFSLRERLAERGRQVAGMFSLQITANQLVPAIKELMLGRVERPKDVHFVYVQRPQEEASREETFLREMSRDTFAGGLPFRSIVSEVPQNITIREILDGSDEPFIAVCLDDTMYFSEEWVSPLLEALGEGFDMASPVCSDFFDVDMPYHTPLTFNDAADQMKQKYRGQYLEKSGIPPRSFAAKRTSLASLPPATPLSEVPGRLKSIIAPSSLVHRFGDYFAFKRDDLLSFIPYGIKKVLDIGCAGGGLGETVKRERGCEVYGAEANRKAAEEAKTKLDAVFCTDIEHSDLPFDKDLDVVIFADVLEHLVEPWSVLRNTLKWLKNDGIVVASIPNVAHYSIILDLLRGRWDYVPSGLLCITHVRFFTKSTIQDMFKKAGYTLLTVKDQKWPSHIRERIEETLSRYIRLENMDENIFCPGFYVVAKRSA
jgi:glycosyltransferase involved in cell wall biosynthesis/2-polyprenyl-3-methyl-5-hydroxy-6-metoxy-1,4-benzoquinol methylase